MSLDVAPVASLHDKTLPIPLLQDSPEIIRLALMMYVRFPLSLRNVEDLLHERGIFDGLSVDNATGIVDQPRLPQFKA